MSTTTDRDGLAIRAARGSAVAVRPAADMVPMPQAPGGLTPGRWVWVDEAAERQQMQAAALAVLSSHPDLWQSFGRRRTWAGLNVPVFRDPIFWVWAFFMAVTSVTTVWVTTDSDKIVSILLVSWASATVVYWFIPAVARQLWRDRQARRPGPTVTRFPPVA